MQIKCDRQIRFAPEVCYKCNRMDIHIGTKKGRNWVCKLNRKASEKRAFYSIMASYWIRASEGWEHLKIPNVEIHLFRKNKKPIVKQVPVCAGQIAMEERVNV